MLFNAQTHNYVNEHEVQPVRRITVNIFIRPAGVRAGATNVLAQKLQSKFSWPMNVLLTPPANTTESGKECHYASGTNRLDDRPASSTVRAERLTVNGFGR